MKKSVLKNSRLLIVGILFLIALCIGIFIPKLVAKAESADNRIGYSQLNLVGDDIYSVEYLYNYDESPDYFYVQYKDDGYAILARNTLELLEYSPSGMLPYTDNGGIKYYGGPFEYIQRENGALVNILTGEKYAFDNDRSISTAQVNRELFNNNGINTYSNVSAETELFNMVGRSSIDVVSSTSVPPIVESNPIAPTGDATYIENYEYFINDPTHGTNNGSSIRTATSGTDIAASDLSDPVTAAKHLTDKYEIYNWLRA